VGIGALLEDGAVRRQNHHTEPVENTGVTRIVDGIDQRVGTLNIDGDLCVRGKTRTAARTLTNLDRRRCRGVVVITPGMAYKLEVASAA